MVKKIKLVVADLRGAGISGAEGVSSQFLDFWYEQNKNYMEQSQLLGNLHGLKETNPDLGAKIDKMISSTAKEIAEEIGGTSMQFKSLEIELGSSPAQLVAMKPERSR